MMKIDKIEKYTIEVNDEKYKINKRVSSIEVLRKTSKNNYEVLEAHELAHFMESLKKEHEGQGPNSPIITPPLNNPKNPKDLTLKLQFIDEIIGILNIK